MYRFFRGIWLILHKIFIKNLKTILHSFDKLLDFTFFSVFSIHVRLKTCSELLKLSEFFKSYPGINNGLRYESDVLLVDMIENNFATMITKSGQLPWSKSLQLLRISVLMQCRLHLFKCRCLLTTYRHRINAQLKFFWLLQIQTRIFSLNSPVVANLMIVCIVKTIDE